MSSPNRDIKPEITPEPVSPVKKAKGRSPGKKSPSKSGPRSVKTEITGTDSSGFRPTSKDMAYHYVMHALEKVTMETRKEIAQKLGVKQKNLDASWGINWKKRVDQVLHDAFCK